jgi:hypothetical protein
LALLNETFTFSPPFREITMTGIAVESYVKLYKPLNPEYIGNGGDWQENRTGFPDGPIDERSINCTFHCLRLSPSLGTFVPVEPFPEKASVFSEIGWAGTNRKAGRLRRVGLAH